MQEKMGEGRARKHNEEKCLEVAILIWISYWQWLIILIPMRIEWVEFEKKGQHT